jgi:hypothetical protein
MTLIVGIAGGKTSGKDTLADTMRSLELRRNDARNTLIARFPDAFKVAFADPLKRMLIPLGFPIEVLWGPSEQRDTWTHPILKMTCRKALQYIGDQVGRQMLAPTIWVDLWKQTVSELKTGGYVYKAWRGSEKLDEYWPGAELSHPQDFPAPTLILAPDIRYENEWQAVKDLNGKTVLVDRPGFENNDAHISEAWVRKRARDVVDTILVNFSTYEAWQEKCVQAWTDLTAEP